MIVENKIGVRPPACTVSDAPDLRIGSAAGQREYELFAVSGAVRLEGGEIAVANAGGREIRVYSDTGVYLDAFGSEGEGPGEFRGMSRIWIDSADTLWVGNPRPWEFLMFKPSGEWVGAVRPQLDHPGVGPGDVAILDDRRSVMIVAPLIGYDADFESQEAEVLVFDGGGRVIQKLGAFPWGRWGIVAPERQLHERDVLAVHRYLESFPWLAGSGDRVVLAHGRQPELLVFSGDETLTLERRVRFEGPELAVTPQAIHVAKRLLEEKGVGVDADGADIPVAERIPAITKLRVGRDGRIWVEEYPRTVEPRRRWLAFGPNGDFVCRLNLPAFEQVFEFGADYVLVLDRDELGIERVLEFRLSGP